MEEGGSPWRFSFYRKKILSSTMMVILKKNLIAINEVNLFYLCEIDRKLTVQVVFWPTSVHVSCTSFINKSKIK